MGDVREQGFGLNFNQGFGSRPGGVVSTFDRAGADNAWNMLGQRRQQDFTGGQNAANRGLQQYLGDQGNATQRYGIDQSALTAREGNRLQYQASILPANLRQERFTTLLPYLDRAMGTLGSGLSGGYHGSGQVGGQPAIDASPVLSQGQVQQQVNAARSGNDASAAGRMRQMQGQLAGRGFGENSPLAMSLAANIAGQNMMANTANERDTRIGAATTNSEHLLKAQQAQESQFASRQQEEIERNKAYTGGFASILSGLGSFGS